MVSWTVRWRLAFERFIRRLLWSKKVHLEGEELIHCLKTHYFSREEEIYQLRDSFERLQKINEVAWVIIANAYGGNWKLASDDWQEAATRWRDHWHELISPSVSITPEKRK